ncbi:membrane protein [Microbacterium phage Endor]|nr:membrane protein [Microbacterium phage Endor]
MPLVEPDEVDYGPTTFSDLNDALATLFANDEYLKGLIDAIPSGPVTTKTGITLGSGYTANAAYVATQTVKTGTMVVLEPGVINCPATFAAGTYYTLGTVTAAHRPTDGKHRMGTGAIFTSTAIIPIQFRINGTNGEINFYSVPAVSGASYIILNSLTWSV